MNCSNCGSEVDGKYCINCGFPAPLTQEENTSASLADNTERHESPEYGGMEVQNEIVLTKTKMIGRATYKTITTTVALKPDTVDVRTATKRFFWKTQTHTKSIRWTNVKIATVHTVMDFWDTLYGIIFAVLGFFAPISFVGAVVCLWCGYGKEIKILLYNGEKTRIPTNSGEAANGLVYLLNKRRREACSGGNIAKCAKCGSNLKKGARFCGECGEDVSNSGLLDVQLKASADEKNNEWKNSERDARNTSTTRNGVMKYIKPLAFLAVILVVVIAIIFAVISLGSNEEKDGTLSPTISPIISTTSTTEDSADMVTELSGYLGKRLAEMEKALSIKPTRGRNDIYQVEKHGGKFELVVDAKKVIVKIHVLESGQENYALLGVTTEMNEYTASNTFIQNGATNIFGDIWACENGTDAIYWDTSGWTMEKDSPIIQEAKLRATTEEAYEYLYEDSEGAYYIGNGQVIEFYTSSFARFVYDYENLTAYQQEGVKEFIDGRYFAIIGTVTGVDPDGKITIICEDPEATEEEGLDFPMAGFAELYLCPEQENLLANLSVDDSILAFGRIDASSYYSVFNGIFGFQNGVAVSLNGKDVDVPFIEGYHKGLTSFDEDGNIIIVFDYTSYEGIYEDLNVNIALSVMPSGTDLYCYLLWKHDDFTEEGVVKPGVPSKLSWGTVITLNLNEDGSLSAVIDVSNNVFTLRLNPLEMTEDEYYGDDYYGYGY